MDDGKVLREISSCDDFQSAFWHSLCVSMRILCPEVDNTLISVGKWDVFLRGCDRRNDFIKWFQDFGASAINDIKVTADLLANFSSRSFRQASYMLDEANDSKDCRYIEEIFALVIERLASEVMSLTADTFSIEQQTQVYQSELPLGREDLHSEFDICMDCEQINDYTKLFMPKNEHYISINLINDNVASSSKDEAFLLEGLTC